MKAHKYWSLGALACMAEALERFRIFTVDRMAVL